MESRTYLPSIDGFQAVRGLEAGPEFLEQPQALQRESFLEPFVETGDGRFVHPREFLADPPDCGEGFRVRALTLGGIQLQAPGGLLPLGQVRQDVLPLVPLTALNGRGRAKDILDRPP